jgi:hypothetical protein
MKTCGTGNVSAELLFYQLMIYTQSQHEASNLAMLFSFVGSTLDALLGAILLALLGCVGSMFEVCLGVVCAVFTGIVFSFWEPNFFEILFQKMVY